MIVDEVDRWSPEHWSHCARLVQLPQFGLWTYWRYCPSIPKL